MPVSAKHRVVAKARYRRCCARGRGRAGAAAGDCRPRPRPFRGDGAALPAGAEPGTARPEPRVSSAEAVGARPPAGPGLPARRPPPAGCSRSECARAGGGGTEGKGPGALSAPGSALRWRERPRGLLGQRCPQPSALPWALAHKWS